METKGGIFPMRSHLSLSRLLLLLAHEGDCYEFCKKVKAYESEEEY